MSHNEFNEIETREIDIFTDVEPDDVLALMLLAKIFRFRTIFVVCSENPLWPRLKVLERLLDVLGSTPNVVPIGYDGQPVAAAFPQLESHFAHAPRRLLLALASFEPLLEVYRHAPQLLSTLDVVAYGSVNIRWALRRSPDLKHSLLNMINHGFNSISVFESYFAYGDSNNTFNPTDTPRFCSFLSASPDPACVWLTQCIRDWNKFLLTSQANALIEYDVQTFGALRHEVTGEICVTDEMKAILRRAAADRSFRGFTKARVILGISSAMETQMVAADPGAAILAIALFGHQFMNAREIDSMTDPIKAQMRHVRVTIPDAFVVVEEESGSKVRYFKPDEPGSAFLTMLENRILEILRLPGGRS